MPFGRGSIERFFYKKILNLLPAGSTLLELGSGWVTTRLQQHYKVISIEHDRRRIKRGSDTQSSIRFVPLKFGWYDIDILTKTLPSHYDAILVDGPPAFNVGIAYSRFGFYVNIDLFNTDGFIFFDDTERQGEYMLAEAVSQYLQRPVIHYPSFGREHSKRRKGCSIILGTNK